MMFNSIQKKILFTNGLLILFLTVILSISLFVLNKNNTLINDQKKSINILNIIKEAEKSYMNYRMHGNNFLLLLQDEFKSSWEEEYNKLSSVFSSINEPEIKVLIEDLNNLHQTTQKSSILFIDDKNIEANNLVKKSNELHNKIQEIIVKNKLKHSNVVHENTKQIETYSNNLISYLYILLTISIALGFILSFVLARKISQPLSQLKNVVENITKNNDLTLRSTINSNDEIGSLGKAFNLMVESMSLVVKELSKQADTLAYSANSLSITAEKNHTEIIRQADAINQVATTTSEMEMSIKSVASSAEQAAKLAKKGNSHATKGNQVVIHTVTSIQNLANNLNHSLATIEQVNQHSENIGAVLGVIKNIAEQTNLLALNAAIEAARAGDQGRGFAVVADEVRTLAQRTQGSTKEIETLIETLQSGALAAVKAMNNSELEVKNSVVQAEKAGSSLVMITESVDNITDLNVRIANAAEQQSLATEEISHNISRIQLITDETASHSKETSSSSEALKQQAEKLRILSAKFRI